MVKRKKNRNKIIERAIEGGLFGAALGALLTGKSKGTIASALVGAAIGASIKALEEAKELDVPVLYEEDGVIYKIYPNGKSEIVKKSKKQRNNIPLTFFLD